MPAEPFESTLELTRPRRAMLLAAFGAGLVALVAFLAVMGDGYGGDGHLLFLAAGAALSAMAVTAVLLFLATRSVRTRAQLRADEQGLSAAGALVLPRARIESGYVQPPAPGAPPVSIVHLVSRRWFERIRIAVHDADEGTRLLAALGLDPARSVAHFRVRQGLFANKRAQATLSAVLMGFGYQAGIFLPPPLKLPGTLLFLALALLNALPSRMSIGADGVLVASLVRRKFYSFANVLRVEPSTWGVVLVTNQGERVELRTRVNAVKGEKMHDATTMAIIARIEAGIARLAASGGAPDPAALVSRGARTYVEWVEALRALRSGGDYRTAAVPEETLWRVVEDPKAEADARAGAALALRESLDAEGRARLRGVVEASASPRVRVALEAIAKEDVGEEELRGAVEGDEGNAERRA